MPGSYLALLSPERRTPPSRLTVPLGNCISVGGVGREDPQQDRSVVGRQPAGIGFFGELVAHPNKRGAQLPPTQRALSGESTSPSVPDTAPRVSFRRLGFVTFKSLALATHPASASPAFQGANTQPPTLRASACPQTPPLPGTPGLLPPWSQGPPRHGIWTLHHFRWDHKGADRPDFPPGRLLAERQPEARVPARRPHSGPTRHLVTRGSQQCGPGLRFSVQRATSPILFTLPEPALHTLASLVLPFSSPAGPFLPLGV